MTKANQAPLPRLSKRRWYVLRLLSGAIIKYLALPFYSQGYYVLGWGDSVRGIVSGGIPSGGIMFGGLMSGSRPEYGYPFNIRLKSQR